MTGRRRHRRWHGTVLAVAGLVGLVVHVAAPARPAVDQPPGQPDPDLAVLHRRPTRASRCPASLWSVAAAGAVLVVGPGEVMRSILGRDPGPRGPGGRSSRWLTVALAAVDGGGGRPGTVPVRGGHRGADPGRLRGLGGGRRPMSSASSSATWCCGWSCCPWPP